MFIYLYEWMQSLAYYMVLMTAVLHVIPNKEYKKYIQFYMGLVIVLILCTPILKVLGLESSFAEIYDANTYEIQLEEIEEMTAYLNEIDLEEYR